MSIAIFAAGCFWGIEKKFDLTKGVTKVEVGYTGGETKNPTYEQVCYEETGHAEAVRINFDENIITYKELLNVFWSCHNPTTLNRQGPDIGKQYRSAIFYLNDKQRLEAEKSKKIMNETMFDKNIVTEITKFDEFYLAEDYHQNYYNDNTNQGYCRYVIGPKLEKFEKVFKDKLKND